MYKWEGSVLSLKIVFGKDGLNINNKKFDPYHFSYKDMEIDVDKTSKKTDVFSMLESLAALRGTQDEGAAIKTFKGLQSLTSRN